VGTVLFAALLRLPALLRNDMDPSALEADGTILRSKESIVPAYADVYSGMILRSALTYDDCPRPYSLAAVCLHAPVLGITVSAISRRTLSFFMCHN
jgi:hypothetical protein